MRFVAIKMALKKKQTNPPLTHKSMSMNSEEYFQNDNALAIPVPT